MGLQIERLDVAIAGVDILRQVSLSVPENTMAGLIGANGAGKTTVIRTVMGLLPARSGQITFAGEGLLNKGAHERARLQISYMPEDRRLIPDLTVTENMLLPAWAVGIKDAEQRLDWIYSLMPEIAEFGTRKAMQLSGGQQKLVALGRALMPGRRRLLLDEPFEGVAPVLARRLSSVLDDLRNEGLTILLAESDDTHSADLVSHHYRIERGTIVADAATASA